MASKDTGPLDWRIAIVDKSGRPTPEFQRRWATQRTNNGLIGFVGVGSGAPTGIPTGDGEVYIDIDATPPILYVAEAGAWETVGVINFTDLADAPHDYTSATDKLVRVNSTADGLEFVTVAAALDALGATQGDVLYRGASGWTVLTPGTSGQLLETGGASADPSWADITDSLDTIGSTQGDVLYRNATGWVVLAPGTSGNVLTTQGASANPIWAPGGGGGGGASTEMPWTPPVLASFSQQNFGVSTTATVPALGGIRLFDPGFGSNTNQLRSLIIPVGTPHWQATARLRRQTPIWNFVGVGLVIRENASGNSLMVGVEGDQQQLGYYSFASDTSFSSDGALGAGNRDCPSDWWMRASYTGTTVDVSLSYDGDYFNLIQSFALSSFFSSTAPTHVGIGLDPNNSAIGSTTHGSVVLDCLSWALVSLP